MEKGTVREETSTNENLVVVSGENQTNNNNIENDDVVDNNNKNQTVKPTVSNNNSSALNPNAVPFFPAPLQQLQNFTLTNANLNANAQYGRPMNGMPVFHQAQSQIIVLTVPSGLPIHNQSGIQIPQMIIPLQIPVPQGNAADHNYFRNQAPLLNMQLATEYPRSSTPMSVSPTRSEPTETPRDSSPMVLESPPSFVSTNFINNSANETATPNENNTLMIPVPGEHVPIVQEEVVESTPLTTALIDTQPEPQPEIPKVEAKPRYNIPSPTKMTTRSRNRKPTESEKRPSAEEIMTKIETQSSQIEENKPKMMKVKVVVVRNKKSKPEVKTESASLFSLQVISSPCEINKCLSDEKETGNIDLEMRSKVDKVVSNEAMDVNNENPQPEVKLELPETTVQTKTKKATKPKAKSKKQLATELKKTIECKLAIKQELGVVKVEPQIDVKTEHVDSVPIKPLEVMVKIEPEAIETVLPEVEVKTEPQHVTIESELPAIAIKEENVISLIDEDDDLPELFTQAPKISPSSVVTTSFPNAAATSNKQESLEQKIFNEAVEHYSRPEVQCAIFFPRLTPRRKALRGDNCSAEYAASGRSHCRVCLTSIKKEELRFGVPVRDSNFGSDYYGNGRVIDHWHHARCFWGTYKLNSAYNIDGWPYLTQSDQKLILECVRQLK